MRVSRILLVVSVVISSAVVGAGGAAAAGNEASATGEWTVAGQRVELLFARAFREPDPFGKGSNPCVLISSEAVPDAAVPDDEEGIAELLDRMREGSLRALQVCFDSTGTKLRSVNDVYTFHPAVSPGRYGLQGYHRFTPQQKADGRIAGKLEGSGDTQSGGSWSDAIELSVPMPPE